MLGVGLNEAAGRTAYLAGFHAAQGLIFETAGRVFKRHSTVQAEFGRLVKDDPRFDVALRTFLPRTYNLKSIADYGTGPGSHVSRESARRNPNRAPFCQIRHASGSVQWPRGLLMKPRALKQVGPAGLAAQGTSSRG